MPDQWTPEHVLALAPDAASAKNGRGLATPSKWSVLGSNATVLWGQCQGSGKDPYRTQIDIQEPAFRCSCPSRKFPCKHGLALFLLFSEQTAGFTEQSPPDWVTEWLEGRSQRAEKQIEKQAKQHAKQADPVAQAKRAATRQQKVQAGVQELRLWLEDRVRQGLVSLQQEPYQTWETMAARMVDAQAPGLARHLRDMAGLAHSGSGWMHRLLAELGQLYLLLEGYERLESLPATVQADVKSQMGWTINQEDVLSSSTRSDLWLVVGQRTEEEDRLKVRRTWLWGLTESQSALLLDFAHGNQAWEQTLLLGTGLEAELAFYPSAYPLRALVKTQQTGVLLANAPPGMDVTTAIAQYHQALAVCPWIQRFPMLLQEVVPFQDQDQWLLQDQQLTVLPLSTHLDKQGYWRLLALSGGYPVTLFGEWNGTDFQPLSVWVEDALYAVGA
jgi:hypothetical protein